MNRDDEKVRQKRLNEKTIETIVKGTLESITETLNQLFDISERAKDEADKIKKELNNLKDESRDVAREVDSLYMKYKDARIKLLEIKRRPYDKCTKKAMEEAYESAQALQIKLVVKREREKSLRKKRDDMERSYSNLTKTREKAEDLLSHIGVVLEYLEGDLENVRSELAGLKERRLMGFELIKAREAERQRIAREIHDGPAQVYANIAFGLEMCERLMQSDPEKLKKELNRLKELARNNLGELRNIIYRLRPVVLEEYGLIKALERYVDDIKDTYDIDTEFVIINDEQKLDPIIELSIYRIVQEAVNNIVKHSGAKKASVKLEYLDKGLNLVISDDGIGFDPNELENNGRHGFGLLNIRERVELLNGQLSILSKPGKGVKLVIAILFEEL